MFPPVAPVTEFKPLQGRAAPPDRSQPRGVRPRVTLTGRTAAAACALAALLAARATPARADDDMFIGTVGAVRLDTPGGGGLERFGSGESVTLAWLEDCGHGLCGGVEGSALFLRGPASSDGSRDRLDDLSIGVTGTPPGFRHRLVPFLTVGFDLAAASIGEPDGTRDRGVEAGVHGAAGLHGMFADRIYLRGQVGYLGAGVGGVAGQIAIGARFE
jgi:hypothetical protein